VSDLHGVFIRVDVDESIRSDPELARKLEEACPVDIFAASEGGVFHSIARRIGSHHMGLLPRSRPITAEMAKSTMATKKISFAISTAVPAMPPKPNRAATSAMMRKVTAQPSMIDLICQ